LLIMLGGRQLLQRFPFFTRNSEKIQKTFGVLMLVTAVALFTGLDRSFQTWILKVFPSYGSGLTALEENAAVQKAIEERSDSVSKKISMTSKTDADPLSLYSGEWFNSEPLLLSELKSKVVMIDFWTYSCINCIRTLPYLQAWHEKYSDSGLVIIGVHSPEFAFEKSADNLKKAMADLGVSWPVVQDNDFGIWNEFKNRYWPAHYLFNKDGMLVYTHFGEGKYVETEKMIKALLNDQSGTISDTVNADSAKVKTRSPETYLGYSRARGFASPEDPQTNSFSTYSFPGSLKKNYWALSGTWNISSEASSNEGKAMLRYQFEAADIYLVIKPEAGSQSTENMVMVSIDGEPVSSGEVQNGILTLDTERLYHLYHNEKGRQAILELTFMSNVSVYAFTFG
jgi:thiol-disulfide isomerase/thioredoxin